MAPHLDPQICKQYINKMFDQRVIPELSKFIQIPNTSQYYDKDWYTNGLLEEAGCHIQKYIEDLQIKGAKTQMIKHQGYSPLLLTEIEGDIKDKTILFYGHFDKQPHGEGWDQNKGPTKPVIQNGKLYGRGGADDGYCAFSSMLAVKTCQQQKIPIPRCIMIFQGDEQSGGHIDYYIQVIKQRIGNPDVIVCLDSGCLDYQRLWLTNSIRGVIQTVVTVKNMSEGVHSGDSSGIVPSVFRIANLLIQRIEDLQTGKCHQDFECDIPAHRYAETVKLAQFLGKQTMEKQFLLQDGVKNVTEDILQLRLNRTWKPQLTITGITGLNPLKTAGNVMIPEITIRLSLRLPPSMDKQFAGQKLKQLLTKDTPFNAKVQLGQFYIGQGWSAPELSPWLKQALEESSKIYYGKQMQCIGQGGSVPFMGILSNMWPKAQYVITGVIGPGANAHGPNQFLHIDYTKRLTECISHVISRFHSSE